MKLLDICETIVDCPHSTAKDEGTGYPLIRTPNVGKGRLKLAGVHRVSENVYNQRNERAVPQVDDSCTRSSCRKCSDYKERTASVLRSKNCSY